jgi:GTP-binding protein Era
VAVLGRPNVGKSTFINAIINSKVSIVSKVPQTTRYLVRGILNLDNAQIVFVDSPGIHSFNDNLAQYLNVVAKKSLSDIELILYMADTSRYPAREEEQVMNFLSLQKTKLIMVLNKIDIGKRFLNEYIEAWRKIIKRKKIKKDPLIYYIPISARTGKNLDELKDVIIEQLPQGPRFYDKETLTDFPLKFRIADIIREKLLSNFDQEIPHSLAVDVLEIEDKKKVVYVSASIYVNRNSQKTMVIGKNAKMIKKIGSISRKELEVVFGKKVYLDIWVKVMPSWQRNTRVLRQLGYEAS